MKSPSGLEKRLPAAGCRFWITVISSSNFLSGSRAPVLKGIG
jgi:hypothetical protein